MGETDVHMLNEYRSVLLGRRSVTVLYRMPIVPLFKIYKEFERNKIVKSKNHKNSLDHFLREL